MTTNKPDVRRYDDMGAGQICPIDNMYESDDGDYVEWEAYEALQVECEKLRKDAERYKYIREGGHWITAATQTGVHLDGEDLDNLIDGEIADAILNASKEVFGT